MRSHDYRRIDVQHFIYRAMAKDLQDAGKLTAKISYLASANVNSNKPTKNVLRKHILKNFEIITTFQWPNQTKEIQ